MKAIGRLKQHNILAPDASSEDEKDYGYYFNAGITMRYDGPGTGKVSVDASSLTKTNFPLGMLPDKVTEQLIKSACKGPFGKEATTNEEGVREELSSVVDYAKYFKKPLYSSGDTGKGFYVAVELA